MKDYNKYLIIGVAIIIGFIIHANIITKPRTAKEYCFQQYYKNQKIKNDTDRANFLIGVCGVQ